MKSRLLAVLVGTGLALTACTGTPEDGEGSTSPPPITASPGPSTAGPPTADSPLTTSQAGDFLRDVKCAADDTGSWSFEADLVNDQPKSRTFTVAIAVTVGMQVKGHDLVVQEVPADSEAHITRNYFAQADDKDAVCEPVVSVEG